MSEKRRLRQDVFTLPEGVITFQWYSPLSPESVQDVKDWLRLVERSIARSVEAPTPNPEEPDGDE